MKLLTALLSLIVSAGASAAPMNMACVTEHPTTSFVGVTENDTITFHLIHHNGVKYMPVWSNVLTPNDLPVIQEAANVLSELGNHLTFTMPEKSCEVDGFMINCFGTQPAQVINGHKVSLWSVYTKFDTETSFAGEYNYIWSSMGLDIDGKTYWVPMKYSNYECFEDWSAKALKTKAKTKKLFL